MRATVQRACHKSSTGPRQKMKEPQWMQQPAWHRHANSNPAIIQHRFHVQRQNQGLATGCFSQLLRVSSKSVVSDSWVLSTIAQGYQQQFRWCPPTLFKSQTDYCQISTTKKQF